MGAGRRTRSVLLLGTIVLAGLMATGGGFGPWPVVGPATESSGLLRATAAGMPALPGHDWPTFLADNGRGSDNAGDNVLNVSNAHLIVNLWGATTHGTIAASAAIVSHKAFVGSWDGNFTAYDLLTGAVYWQQFLGTSVYCPSQVSIGVSSSATVYNNTVYVGGGNGTYWAMNASTGKVVWVFQEGLSTKGYYSWSSPLVWKGNVYVGVASLCDQPLVPGGLYELYASNGSVEHRFRTTVGAHLGGSIWSSPALDAATNTIYVTTGNPPNNNDGTNYTQAVIALNATTLAVTSYWHVPAAQSIFDGDFGATPTLFTDSTGRPLVGAVNKNGWFYALYRQNLSAGPVWERRVSHPSSIAPAAFAGGLLFIGTKQTKVGGVVANGSIEAVTPGNGTIVWQDPLTGPDFAAPTAANGLLFVGAGKVLSVINAANGAVLTTFPCSNWFLSAPSVGHGVVVEGCANGHVRAFGLLSTSGGGFGPWASSAGVPAGGTAAALLPARLEDPRTAPRTRT
ncbi:MAG: PQQ-binding-like beta-propeller repeat protein [Thermoplasmata archaeon]|nr:PQQ-binding-like beta-propeller repeat protein [Thermoplasmata archaeon]